MVNTDNIVTLYNYIAATEDEPYNADDVYDNFIVSVMADSFFPRGITADNDGFVEAFKYLYYNYRSDDEDMNAFYKCWEEYYKAVTGSAWVDAEYNARAFFGG